eukprot:ctg_144.g146
MSRWAARRSVQVARPRLPAATTCREGHGVCKARSLGVMAYPVVNNALATATTDLHALAGTGCGVHAPRARHRRAVVRAGFATRRRYGRSAGGAARVGAAARAQPAVRRRRPGATV